MTEEKSFTKKITIEKNRIIVESDNKAWLDYIEQEILTMEIAGLNPTGSKDLFPEMAAKFVDKCWKSLGIRAVLRCLVYQFKGSVRHAAVQTDYEKATGKQQGLAGTISGIRRNSKKFLFNEHWLTSRNTSIGKIYEVDEKVAKILEIEVVKRLNS